MKKLVLLAVGAILLLGLLAVVAVLLMGDGGIPGAAAPVKPVQPSGAIAPSPVAPAR